MTRKVAYGAALSLAVGLGLGAWLAPPKPHYGSAVTPVVAPPEQADPWSAQSGGASTQTYAQADPAPEALQAAAVSPPAGAAPGDWPAAPRVQPAVQTTSTADPARPGDADQAPWQAGYTQRKPVPVGYDSRAQPQRADGGDWADEDGPDRGDDRNAAPLPPPRVERPPEPRWAPPPERRPSMQDRRWDFRPDGSAVPLDDPEEGNG